MSTKIPNGLLIRADAGGVVPFDRVATVLEILRDAVLAESRKKLRSRLAHLASSAADMRALGRTIHVAKGEGYDPSGLHSPVSWALSQVMHRQAQVRQTGVRDPDYDFECSVALWPCSVGVLLNVSSEHDEHLIAWWSLPGTETCRYWNNTDRPPGITEDVWERRALLWAETQRSNPMTYDCIGERGLPFDTALADLVAAIPPTSVRARAIACEDAINDRCGSFSPSPSFTAGGLMARVRKAAEWVRGPEGEADVEARRAAIEPRLPTIDAATLGIGESGAVGR